MNTHMLELKRRFVKALGRAALEYLEAGFDLFHRHRRSEISSRQAAFGTLATALELTLKCVLAEKNPAVVFRTMPPDARAILASPERVPEFFRWRASPVDLWSRSLDTVSLAECIAGYYIFVPHMKQLLVPHLSHVDTWADQSRRAALPVFPPYGFDRAGYAVLQAAMSLESDPGYHANIAYSPSETDRKFLDEFSAKRVERVSLSIDQARFSAPEQVPGRRGRHRSVGSWDRLILPCPVCSTDAVIEGYTELSMARGEEGPEPGLDFFAVSFSCPTCGLILYDLEELKLAGVDTIYDRSGEIELWFGEHGGMESWDIE